jgi:TonB family protein
MSSGSVSPRLFSVLVSTRPERQNIARHVFAAIVGHLLLLAALVLASNAEEAPPAAHRFAQSEEAPPLLIQFASSTAARGGGMAAARVAATPKKGSAALRLAPAVGLPNLAEVESALLSAADSVSRVFAAGVWSIPRVATRKEMEQDLGVLAKKPRFTSVGRVPSLVNRSDVQKFLSRRFPYRLRQMGGEARAMLWMLIDPSGRVYRAQLSQSSGNADADSIALLATNHMRFRPAEDGGRIVPVWVQMPVGFRVLDE